MLKTESRNLCNVCLIGGRQRDRAQTMSKRNWGRDMGGLGEIPTGIRRESGTKHIKFEKCAGVAWAVSRL